MIRFRLSRFVSGAISGLRPRVRGRRPFQRLATVQVLESRQLLTVSSSFIKAWGPNANGQVSLAPTDQNYTMVAGGLRHGIALKADGSIVDWGSGDFSDYGNLLTNTPSGTGFKAVGAGYSTSFALSTNGTISAWGSNDQQVVSNKPTGSGFTFVTGNWYNGLALASDGSISVWGANGANQISGKPSGTGYTALAAGSTYAYALASNGSIVAWGGNSTDSQRANAPSTGTFTAIAAGDYHAVALKSDGSLVSWGSNSSNQVSDTPTGTGFIAVAAGASTSYALKSDGSIVAWGNNGGNQITNVPAGTGFTAIAAAQSGVGFALTSVSNSAPTDIALSASSIAENQPSGTQVGLFSTTDPDAGNTFTYTLVSGTGSTDNASFTIGGTSGNSLLTAASFNFETKSSYSIRVKTTDQGGASFEKQFTITVSNVNEAPTNLTLSASSIAENQPAGTQVGVFSGTDPDAATSFTYFLVSGAGDTDNASFTIGGTAGNSLLTAASFDFETKSSYSIRVGVSDGTLSFAKQFTITVSNVNEAPTNITLSASSIAENQPTGTTVGTFSSTDPDADTTFTYTLVSGSGDSGNSSFQIDGDTLKTNGSLDFETQSSYSIRVRSTDQGGAYREQVFVIEVTNGNDAPTAISLSNVVSEVLANASTASAINLGDVAITDDAWGTNTVTISGPDAGNFEIVDGKLRLKAGTVLNYQTQKTYSITVNVDDATLGANPDASVDYTLTLQALQSTVVQDGSAGRSYVRYVTLNFETELALADVVASLGTSTPRIRLVYGGAGGKTWAARNLTSSMVSQVGNQLRIDFGAEGIGGNRNSQAGDGLYRLRVDLDGDGTSENIANFFKLFGDVDGNGIVNKTDTSLVTAAQGTTGVNLAADTDGDGDVDAADLANVKKRQGAKVTPVV